jgi:hypothetical protein
MKNFSKKLFLVLLAFMPFISTNVMADGEIEPIPIKPNTPINPNPTPRPRSPRRPAIVATPECFYCNGEVTIYAADEITAISASVVRYEDDAQWSGASNDNELSFLVSTDPGTYILTLTTSDGKSYYGEYILY